MRFPFRIARMEDALTLLETRDLRVSLDRYRRFPGSRALSLVSLFPHNFKAPLSCMTIAPVMQLHPSCKSSRDVVHNRSITNCLTAILNILEAKILYGATTDLGQDLRPLA